MDRIPDVDVINSPIDVPEQWIQFVDENVVASMFHKILSFAAKY
jgi:hypothetical protein